MLDKVLSSSHFYAGITIVTVFIIYLIVKFFVKKSLKIVLIKSDAKKKDTIITLVVNLLKYILIFFTIMLLFDIYQVNTGRIIASLGVLGIIIGLAIQDLLKDIIVGFSIVLEGIYKVGDTVTIKNFKGEIIEVSLKTTKIKSFSGEILTISNRNVGEVINHSLVDSGTLIDILLKYEEDLEIVDKVADKIVNRINEELDELTEEMKFLGIAELSDSGIKIRFFFRTKYSSKFATERRALRIILEVFKEEKIKVPYNRITIINN